MRTLHVYGERSGLHWTVKILNRAECLAAGRTYILAEWWDVGREEAKKANEPITLIYRSRRRDRSMAQRFSPAGPS